MVRMQFSGKVAEVVVTNKEGTVKKVLAKCKGFIHTDAQTDKGDALKIPLNFIVQGGSKAIIAEQLGVKANELDGHVEFEGEIEYKWVKVNTNLEEFADPPQEDLEFEEIDEKE